MGFVLHAGDWCAPFSIAPLRDADPAERAKEKVTELRMHAELAAVWESLADAYLRVKTTGRL